MTRQHNTAHKRRATALECGLKRQAKEAQAGNRVGNRVGNATKKLPSYGWL